MAGIRARLGTLLLFAASFLLSLAFLETVARLTVGRGSVLSQGTLPLGRYHPLLGWEKTPGAEARLKRAEYDVHVAINAHGLRGPDREYAKPVGTKRVLILGDSFGEGYYVEEDQSVRALLEKGLQSSHPRAEVLNGSTAGYSTDQEYLFFTSEGSRYRPEVVVLFVFSNDLPDNLSGIGNALRQKPFFSLRKGALVLENTPVPKTRASEEGRASGLQPFHHSVLLRWLSNQTETRPGLHEALAALHLVPPLSRDPPRDFAAFRADGRRDEMWELFGALLGTLDGAVRDCGGRLIVLYVPVRFEVEDPAWDTWLERYPPHGRWDRDRMARRLGEACTKAGVPFVDPRAALRSAGGPAYFPLDGHWNVLGNRVVTDTLLPRVNEALEGPQADGAGGG